MSCNTQTNHLAPVGQPLTLRRVRGVIERIKAHMTVSVADATGQYEELLELEIELTALQLRAIRAVLGGAQ